MSINYTPFSTYTDDELIREVCNKNDPSDLELELMERLTHWKEYAATLTEQYEDPPHPKCTFYTDGTRVVDGVPV